MRAARSDRKSSSALYLALLHSTLSAATRLCQHYQQYDISALQSLSDIQKFPTLDRGKISGDLSSFCAPLSDDPFFYSTSGTSSGRSLYVPHSRAEAKVSKRYRSDYYGTKGDDGSNGVTLRLVPGGRLYWGSVDRGNTVIAPYFNNMARENLWDNWDTIIGQVFAGFPTGRSILPITAIHATPPYSMVLLTRYMLQRGLDPSSSSVSHLVATGSWMGLNTRKWLQETWGATIQTNYSCAELNFSAPECPDNPFLYHFDHHVLPEVVDDRCRQVLPGQSGAVLLTGLYPFHQACFLIRYANGDWARWEGIRDCSCGLLAPSITLMGRSTNLTVVNSPTSEMHWIIAPLEVLNALDSLDCIPKVPRPQYLFVQDNNRLTLKVECYALGTDQWQSRIGEEIRENLLNNSQGLCDAVSDGEIKFSVELYPRSALSVKLHAR